MRVKVLKAFPYAHDGRHTVLLVPSEESVEVRDDLVTGLEDAEFVRRVGSGKTASKGKV